MPSSIPADSYPVASQAESQIRLDIVRPSTLTGVAIPTGTGSNPDTQLISPADILVLYPTVDCIINFQSRASTSVNNSPAALLIAQERATIMPPIDMSSFSVIALAGAAGTLYIQKIIPWAGLGNPTSLSNR